MVFKKVAIYLRKSRFDEESETQEEVLARHKKLLMDYCKRNNLLVEKIYEEVVSGENIENRPQVQKLLDDVANGLYDGVVVIEIERLSRGNPVDQVEILETFKEAKAKIYTLQKVYDFSTDNDIDEEYFEFGLFMSRREYKTIRRRLIRGIRQAKKEGFYVGSVCPFGYDKYKDKGWILTPNKNASVVKMVFNKYAYENASIYSIICYLNDLGIKPLRSKGWGYRSINKMLKNKVYIGLIKQGNEYYQGKHEPLIDNETFEIVQKRISTKDTPRVTIDRSLINPFAGLMYCKKCGSRIDKHHCNARYPNQHILACSNRNCKCVGAFMSVVESKVIEMLENELKDFHYFLNNNNDEIIKKSKALEKEISVLKAELTKKENMIIRCSELLEEGIYSKEKYFDRTETLNAEIDFIKEKIDTLQEKSEINELENTRTFIPKLEMVLKEYWNLSPEDKNKLLKSIITKIEYNKSVRSGRNKEDKNFTLDIILQI